jgi:hypothetical protein
MGRLFMDMVTGQPRRRAFATRRRLALVCLAGIAGLGTAALEIFPSVAAGSAGKPLIGAFQLSKLVHPTRALLFGQIQPFGSDTLWEIRYSDKPITSCKEEGTFAAKGVVETPSEKGSEFYVELHRLTPETTYHAVLCAENASGPATATTEVTTTPAGPPEIVTLEFFGGGEATGLHTTSAKFEATVESDGLASEYRVEYAKSVAALDKKEGILVTTGSVSVAEDFSHIEPHVEGLEPATEYQLRVVASNAEGVATETFPFTTKFVHPGVKLVASAIRNITGSSVDVGDGTSGAFVYPGTFETSWWFETGPSEAGPWTRASGAEGTIPQAEADEALHPVSAKISGLQPATAYYVRLNAENSKGPATGTEFPAGGPLEVVGFQTAAPPKAETFAVHGIHGEALRLFASVRQAGIDTHFHFQYVTQEDFEAGGWAKAEDGPEEDAGSGTTHVEFRGRKAQLVVFDSQIVAGDVPSLRAGVMYRFRVVASNAEGGAQGQEQVLTVPAAAGAGGGEACAGGFRAGLSLHLADCRAYEQVTPVNKEGSQELFQYSATMNGNARVGEDGEHVMHQAALTHYGSDAGPYLFSRTPAGWRLTAASPKLEAGVNRYLPTVFDPNLTQFGFESIWQTAENCAPCASPTVEFRAGPVGGPYVTVATVTHKQGGGGGWVASSEDFGHLFLQIEDHVLLGPSTGTVSGSDLYEYAEGGLRQVNVLSGAGKIGSCGAKIANGFAEKKEGHRQAVSRDGSRVFFEAVPGSECSMPAHLYVRIDHSETRDLGVYRFGAANAQGTVLLLQGPTGELVLYDVESKSAKAIPVKTAGNGNVVVSDHFAAIYFASTEQLVPEAPVVPNSETPDLYRYDIASGTLRYLVQVKHAYQQEPSPDGRYDYFRAVGVTGLPAGVEHCQQAECGQLFRVDSVDSSVDCVSCASPSDPEPKLGIEDEDGSQINASPGVYESGDGSYAFFVTPSALVPEDQNGEVPAELAHGEGIPEHPAGSPSNDVYEWRAPGVGGCARLAGCVSLITPGTDGYLVALLGSAHEGRDVFFTTHSSLLPQDNDHAGDIYDARIGGGFPAAVVPVECEGDACSTPASPPVDQTPSSSTFSGAGNLFAPAPLVKPKPRGGLRKCFKRGRHHKRVRVKCKKPKPKGGGGKRARSGSRGGGG